MISLFHQNPLLQNTAAKYGIIDKYVDGISRLSYSEEILRQSMKKLLALQKEYAISEMVLLLLPSRALWLGENRDIEVEMHDSFAALLKSEGLAVVDLRPVFEASGNPMQYHFQHDGHWNINGHEKAAQKLFQFIRATRHMSSLQVSVERPNKTHETGKFF